MSVLERRTEEIANNVITVINEKVENIDINKTQQEKIKARKGISIGITLLNLALTDIYNEGLKLGTMNNLVGDSSSGKTYIALTLLAEAIKNKYFDNYDLLYDESEYALFMDLLMFGDRTGRIKTDIHSKYISDLHKNVLTVLHKGPCIYVEDSFDGIKSKEEENREKKLLKERKKKAEAEETQQESDDEEDDDEPETKEKGSYNLEKQKYASAFFRSIVGPLWETESLFLVISQTRDKINAMFGDKKTRSGGAALRFYSATEIWLSVKGEIKDNNREIGINVIAKVKKNKITGKHRVVEFPIYYSYGVGNVESMVNWMLKEGFWDLKGRTIYTKGDFGDLSRKDLIKYIDDNNLEEKCSKIVGECWNQIEDEIKIKLKPRY